MKSETATQRKRRLAKIRQHTAKYRATQTEEEREARLQRMREHDAEYRATQTEEEREARLQRMREHNAESRASQAEEDRIVRLSKMRKHNAECRDMYRASKAAFLQAINTFCDQICEICTKRCYPYQICKWNVNTIIAPYLPNELRIKKCILICGRCKSHINSKKKIAPSKSYWNNLDPGLIPGVIETLSQPEQRLISRIVPFLKIIKLSGLFGQYGFRGQAVLFAQDVFEVTDKLHSLLPRNACDSGIAVITERLENINVTRQFTISREKVYAALHWLIANNPLYKDVTINNAVDIDEAHIIRVEEVAVQNEFEPTNESVEQQTNHYKRINDLSRIIRASWHQANDAIFTSGYAGVQCSAMALANILRASILPPKHWSTNILNLNMITGDKIYTDVRNKTETSPWAYPIENNGYLLVRNFNLIKNNIIAFNRRFQLHFDEEPNLFGSLDDKKNQNNIGLPLRQAFMELFSNHNAGILITGGKSFGLIYINNKYYFTDSHSCGPKGAKALENGRACVIECDTIDELVRISKRTTHTLNVQYTIDFIDVEVSRVPEVETPHINQCSSRDSTGTNYNNSQQRCIDTIPLQTSIMAAVDTMQPNVEDELIVSRNINEITRKSTDNIVNEAHELKAEELSWFFLFPYGKNGLREERQIKISPLDYFQQRILGGDTRFQRNDYLFYALSFFELYRVKSTISACGKKVVNQAGVIEDIHLYMRNLRGSAAYWRSALNELLAQIRCLGPPTYFMTFSANDLNWLDIRKALLLADGRPDVDPSAIDIFETQQLIERYPVILSRQFMVRVNALMKYIKYNHELFGGRVKDHWWRIEFQRRGSPHLHMVVWVENHPEFDTEEGRHYINRNCSCRMPTAEEDQELHDLVKLCQMHRHTETCTKNNVTTIRCRFNFPRQECRETRIVSHSSDDFIRNGGRICLLQRRKEDAWVNNYHPVLLKMWTGNMDIQPCGSNEAIAYYIAKYLSKGEPEGLDSGIAQAIQQIQREESDISRKMFRVCMKLLHERQISAAECAFRLCHIPLRDSSRSCVFLNTRLPGQRYRVLQFDKNGQATGYCSNIFERYEKRPLSHPDYNFTNMSLTEFAMLFEPFYNKKCHDVEESVDHDAYEVQSKVRRQLITLTDNNKMAVRNTPAVVRVPYFIASSDPQNFFYSLLVQYMPFRLEQELLEGYENAKDAFLARENMLKEMSEHMRLHRECDQQLENAFNQVHAFDVLEHPVIINVDSEDEVELPDANMTNNEFQRAQKSMNIGQRQLFQYITECIRKQFHGDENRVKLFITGGAGTGKTFIFNLLKNQVNRCYGKAVVKVGALTGVAARLVGGTTLHRLLKLPVQKDGVILNLPLLTGNYLRVMRQQWQNVEFLFIDEVSMIPYEMLCMIDSRIRQLKNPNAFFGGINVLLFGDLMQLPPVRGHQIFQQPDHMKPATHLWRLFNLVELRENMRQQGDTTFIDILNALRVGELTSEHIKTLLEKVSTEYSGEFSIEKALRIYPTNEQVTMHNNQVLKHFRDKGTHIYTIKAQDQLIDATRKLGDKSLDSVIPVDINKTGGLPKELQIFVGAKVMLRSNIDVEKGLVNGNMGFITEIIWPHFRRDQLYDSDIPSVRVDFGQEGIHLIKPISIQFSAKFSYGTAERRMLPLILSWASTVHKMQGCTVDFAVIYLGSRLFAPGQAYVALSRGRSLNGIQIQELDCTKLTGKVPCNRDALEEMDRLRK